MANPSQYVVDPNTGETLVVAEGETDAGKVATYLERAQKQGFRPATQEQIAQYDKERAAYRQVAESPVTERVKTAASALGRGAAFLLDVPALAATVPEALAGAAEKIGTTIRPDLAEAYRRQTQAVAEQFAPAKKVYRQITPTALEQSVLGVSPEVQRAREEVYSGAALTGTLLSFVGPQLAEKIAEKSVSKAAVKTAAAKTSEAVAERIAAEAAPSAERLATEGIETIEQRAVRLAEQESARNPAVLEATANAQAAERARRRMIADEFANKDSLASKALKLAQESGTQTLAREVAAPVERVVEKGAEVLLKPSVVIGERLVSPIAERMAESSVRAFVDAAPAVRALPKVTQEIVAKAAAQGAGSVIDMGLFQLGQGVHEDILGDHDLTAERLWAHMSDGALTNAVLGAGLSVLPSALRGALNSAEFATKTTRDVFLKHYPQMLRYMGYAPIEAEMLIANREALRAGKATLPELIEQQMQRENPLPPMVQPSLGEAIAGIQPPVPIPQPPGRLELPPEIAPLGVPKPVAPAKLSEARMEAQAIVGLPPPILKPAKPVPPIEPPEVPALGIPKPIKPLSPIPPSQIEAMAVDFTRALREERKATRALRDEVKKTVLPEQISKAVNAEYAARTLAARQAYLDSIGGLAKTPEQLAQAIRIADEVLAPTRQAVRDLSGPIASAELRRLSQAATPIWVSRFEEVLGYANEVQRLSEVAKDAAELQRGVARLQDRLWELKPTSEELRAMTEKEKVVAGMVMDIWRNFKGVSEDPRLWGESASKVTKWRNASTRFLTAEQNWMSGRRAGVAKKIKGGITLRDYDTDKIKKLLQRVGKPEEMDWVEDYREYRDSLRDVQGAAADLAQGYERNYGAEEFASRLADADVAETKAFDVIAKRTNHAAEVESFEASKQAYDDAVRQRNELVEQRKAEIEQLKFQHGENTAAYKAEKAIIDAKNAERDAELTRRIEDQKADYEARLAKHQEQLDEYKKLVEQRDRLVEERKSQVEQLKFEYGQNTEAYRQAKKLADEANDARESAIKDRIKQIKDAPKAFQDMLDARKQAAKDRAVVLGDLGKSGALVDHLETAGVVGTIGTSLMHLSSPYLAAASLALKGGRIVANPVKTMKTLAWIEKGGQITNKALRSSAEIATGVAKGAVNLSMPIRASINMKQERELYEERAAKIGQLVGDAESLTAHADEMTSPIKYDAPKITEQAKGTKVRAVATVAAALPQPPLTLSPVERMNWKPTDTQVRQFNRTYDSVAHPTGVFARIADGTVTKPEIDMVKTVYPALTEHYKQLILENLRKNPNVSAARRQMLSQFFGISVDGAIRQGASAQGVYEQQYQPQQQRGQQMPVSRAQGLGTAGRAGAETQASREAQDRGLVARVSGQGRR